MDVATLSNKLTETAGYVVRPNFEEKFRSTKIQEILYSCISDILGDKKFEQDACPEWTKTSKFISRSRIFLFSLVIRDERIIVHLLYPICKSLFVNEDENLTLNFFLHNSYNQHSRSS